MENESSLSKQARNLLPAETNLVMKKRANSLSFPITKAFNHKTADSKPLKTDVSSKESLVHSQSTFPLNTLASYYSTGRGRKIINKKYGLTDSDTVPSSREESPFASDEPRLKYAERPDCEIRPSSSLSSYIITKKLDPKSAVNDQDSKESSNNNEPLEWRRVPPKAR